MACRRMCPVMLWCSKLAVKVLLEARLLRSSKRCGRKSCCPAAAAIPMPLLPVMRKAETTWWSNCKRSCGAWALHLRCSVSIWFQSGDLTDG